MSISSNSLKVLSTEIVRCYCGELANLKISCTDRNPSRRFYNCKIGKKTGGCNYFRWYDDDDFSSQEKKVICRLLKKIKILERDRARKKFNHHTAYRFVSAAAFMELAME
ncbi:hypothetical protein HAX54_024412 [Datura stramonium]|uniref:GRF-type domain-containing protein n=1 Tax=Datura stramonium TaxID=4076 RepID=A0ABS8V036_DATST|nr:hypothetical protein [Datura stramonium]